MTPLQPHTSHIAFCDTLSRSLARSLAWDRDGDATSLPVEPHTHGGSQERKLTLSNPQSSAPGTRQRRTPSLPGLRAVHSARIGYAAACAAATLRRGGPPTSALLSETARRFAQDSCSATRSFWKGRCFEGGNEPKICRIIASRGSNAQKMGNLLSTLTTFAPTLEHGRGRTPRSLQAPAPVTAGRRSRAGWHQHMQPPATQTLRTMQAKEGFHRGPIPSTSHTRLSRAGRRRRWARSWGTAWTLQTGPARPAGSPAAPLLLLGNVARAARIPAAAGARAERSQPSPAGAMLHLSAAELTQLRLATEAIQLQLLCR